MINSYIPRLLEDRVQHYLKIFPVVSITGPRQSGKSTLLKSILPQGYTYVSFDDRDNIDSFLGDHKRFMARFGRYVIFDEAQKVPQIFDAIKKIVDENREIRGQFILTGSCQFGMLQSITESLAGRVGLLTLLPMQYAEIPLGSLRAELPLKGGYPELIRGEYAHLEEWFRSYITTYIEKDVRQIQNIPDLRSFHLLIKLLAANVSQQVHYNQLAVDLGVSVPTVKRWLHVLEASYIIFFLPPFYKNYGKRLVKAPKVYFYDPGLVAYLLKVSTEDLFHNGPFTGALFENFVISEIKKNIAHKDLGYDLYYLRTEHGIEVDLIIDKGLSKELLEIKHSQSYQKSMLKSIELFRENGDLGRVLYSGETVDCGDSLYRSNYGDYLLEIASK